jgi:two-component system sensor histidine kinase/response regulator
VIVEGKILIVDDTPQNLDVARGLLESSGYETIIATSGEKAIQRAKQQLPDLILLDIQMPGMDGFETCEELKSSTITNQIPIMFLTALSDTDSVLKGFEVGAVDYITKPFKAQELLARVNTHIKNVRMSQQLEAISKSKDKFISIIAHDLKNPFNAILGMLEMLLEDYEEFSDYEIIKYLHDLASSSKKAYKLLENLLQWSRSQFGVLEVYPEKFSMSSIVSDVVDVAEAQASNKNIHITKLVIDGLFGFADPEMINTVLRNLITNAIKYSFENTNIEVAAIEKNGFIEVRIKDQGVGISEESREKLFKIDEVVSTPGTNHESGSGLGLLLCKEFVEKNGGKIWVENNPEGGTLMKFTIPKAD